uniref:Uncharacterized protein n=1 Tax=Oryza brachyantha TaxID=4533 RepID=J3MM94_ORYBR
MSQLFYTRGCFVIDSGVSVSCFGVCIRFVPGGLFNYSYGEPLSRCHSFKKIYTNITRKRDSNYINYQFCICGCTCQLVNLDQWNEITFLPLGK